MSTLATTNIKHPSSASNNIVLDSSGNVVLQAGSASTPALQPSGDTNTGIFFPAADTIAFAEGGAEAARIDSSGRLLVGTSTATANGGVLELSGGITFPATAVAASNANTLDDYEEGTFTPTIAGTSAAGAGTYSTQVGSYTKIGNTVSFTIQLIWSAHTGTGNMELRGLPFTSLGNPFSVNVRADNLTLSANSYCIFSVLASSTVVQMAQTVTGTVSGANIAMDTSANVTVSGTYFAS